MKTLSKITDATVLVGSLFVGYGAIKAVSAGMKSKSGVTIALGAVTLLIAVYALNEARQKINN